MDSRERFRQTMGYGRPDRVPFFHEGMEEEVVEILGRYGFRPGQYSKIVVSWGWEEAAIRGGVQSRL